MGANHFSQTVFGAPPAEVRELLVRWMRAKGFDLRTEPPIARLDPKHERGIRLAWKGKRTVVMYSDLAEQPRMLFELKKLGVPVLDYWMHDSDIWGYQLWVEGAVVDAFHSNPAYFGGHEDIEGPRDIAALCRTLGAVGKEAAIERLQEANATFAEGISSQFVAALGVPAAAARYGHAEDMGWPPEGFESESLVFRQADWDPMAGWEVDRLRFEVMGPAGWAGDLDEDQRAAYEAQVRRARWVGRIFQVLFWPIGQVFRLWFWWRMRAARREAQAMAEGMAPATPFDISALPRAFEQVDDRLVNADHRCSIRLPEDADLQDHHTRRLGLEQVFRFQVGESQVQCTALMPAQAEQMTRFGPPDSEILEDRFTAGEHAVRWVEHTWAAPHRAHAAESPERMWRCLAFVAGPRAVYQFAASAQNPPSPELVAAVRDAAASLRFDPPG